MRTRPLIAVSACVLGSCVRYDGTHKRHDDLLAWWALRVRWLPLCPEVMADLGVPRPPIRLVETEGALRVEEVASGRDHTAVLRAAAERVVAQVLSGGVSGFVAKARSPSCGVGDASLLDAEGREVETVDGLAVAAVRAALPGLPVASEAMLPDREAAEAFLEQVLRYATAKPG